MSYKIIEIPADSYDSIEQIGTKEKFWFTDKKSKTKTLFKIGRPGTGENWAEKAASELAKLLGLPCAEYEFAVWNEKEGVISPLFQHKDARLVHGNEILATIMAGYPKKRFYKVREHRLLRVLAIIKRVALLPVNYKGDDIIRKSLDVFIGYLMFDCWISNPDRHHENWGLVVDSIGKSVHLAPTYDHASGFGCRVSDEERVKRLHTDDTRYNVGAFVMKAKSAFYDEDLIQLKTIDTFSTAAKHNIIAANHWLNKLEAIDNSEIISIFKRIPKQLISQSAIEFALAILESNKNRLIESIKND